MCMILYVQFKVLGHRLNVDADGKLSLEQERQAKAARTKCQRLIFRNCLCFPLLWNRRELLISQRSTRHLCRPFTYLHLPKAQMRLHRSTSSVFSTRQQNPGNTVGPALRLSSFIVYSNYTRWWSLLESLWTNLLVYPVSVEGARELPNFLKNHWQAPVFMHRGKHGFYSLKYDAKNW